MKRGVYAALILSVLCAGLWTLSRTRDKKIDTQITSPVLKADETAKIVLDLKRHTVTRVVRAKAGETVTRSFLNSHGPVALIEKNGGQIVLVQRTWGTEVSPFVGGAMGSDIRARAALGLNLFYVQRWELGGGLLLTTRVQDTRLFAHVSYNVYDNYYLSVGADNHRTVQVMAGLKF